MLAIVGILQPYIIHILYYIHSSIYLMCWIHYYNLTILTPLCLDKLGCHKWDITTLPYSQPSLYSSINIFNLLDTSLQPYTINPPMTYHIHTPHHFPQKMIDGHITILLYSATFCFDCLTHSISAITTPYKITYLHTSFHPDWKLHCWRITKNITKHCLSRYYKISYKPL